MWWWPESFSDKVYCAVFLILPEAVLILSCILHHSVFCPANQYLQDVELVPAEIHFARLAPNAPDSAMPLQCCSPASPSPAALPTSGHLHQWYTMVRKMNLYLTCTLKMPFCIFYNVHFPTDRTGKRAILYPCFPEDPAPVLFVLSSLSA